MFQLCLALSIQMESLRRESLFARIRKENTLQKKPSNCKESKMAQGENSIFFAIQQEGGGRSVGRSD